MLFAAEPAYCTLQLSVDRRFASVFKSFSTGPGAKAKQTWGSFGVSNVTGRGHVSAA
jgi:hypothetical protein